MAGGPQLQPCDANLELADQVRISLLERRSVSDGTRRVPIQSGHFRSWSVGVLLDYNHVRAVRPCLKLARPLVFRPSKLLPHVQFNLSLPSYQSIWLFRNPILCWISAANTLWLVYWLNFIELTDSQIALVEQVLERLGRV